MSGDGAASGNNPEEALKAAVLESSEESGSDELSESSEGPGSEPDSDIADESTERHTHKHKEHRTRGTGDAGNTGDAEPTKPIPPSLRGFMSDYAGLTKAPLPGSGSCAPPVGRGSTAGRGARGGAGSTVKQRLGKLLKLHRFSFHRFP